MSDELIEGRNLISHGRFSAGWNTPWKHNGQGNVKTFTDPEFENYLMMNGLAIVSQIVEAPVFTEAQMSGVTYRCAFRYENYGEGSKSKVVLRTEAGKEILIDLSGTIPGQPLADWNHYPSNKFDGMTAADRNVTVELHGSDSTGSSGLRMTDIKLDVQLVPLVLRSIQLDDRVYEP